MTVTSDSLLVELFVEELPPASLKALGDAFASTLGDGLRAQGLLGTDSVVTAYATPRRLAAHIANVSSQTPFKEAMIKLMPKKVGINGAGDRTEALAKRLDKEGYVHDDEAIRLDEIEEKGVTYLALRKTERPMPLAEVLQEVLGGAIIKLPIAKVMTYQLDDGWTSVDFVRPAHGLVVLYGADELRLATGEPLQLLGLQAGRHTHGHRFEGSVTKIFLRGADSYEAQLESEGAVIPSFTKRRAEILRQLLDAAAREGLKPIEDDALLDEVAALVELPNVLVGKFEKEFLSVPQECLILTMKANQKYFPLLDSAGGLTNKFVIVSNIRPLDADMVIVGNERVVRPRLADAKFFYDQDRKKTLESRVEKLGGVVYHNKLGTQLQRVERISTLAGTIARLLGADKADAELAARLSKADLLTGMVGEFPALQGIMGRYYALHDGEKQEVADAIEAHYHPRFAGDTLPEGNIACALALADKLETLVGIYGIGQIPTGEKDPYGLRRHALGILRILIETPLDLPLGALLRTTVENFPQGMLGENVAGGVEEFMLDRLRGYLRERNFEASHIEAVLYILNGRLHQALLRLEGVRVFASLEVSKDLAAANKRVQNIIRKNHEEIGPEVAGAVVNPVLLVEAAEKDLFHAMKDIAPIAQEYLDRGDYRNNLKVLVTLKPFIDDFFEKVMVMCESKNLRMNRAALLQQLANLMNQVADISKLAI
jgi:glycyl-tRNA synthetase beta chain